MSRLWPSLLGAAQVVSTGNNPSRASCGVYGILALEIAAAGRAAKDRSRVARSHPTNEQGKPKVGSIRIHGELLMLGFEVSTVSKYMVQGWLPSQGWKTFFRNHAQAIAAIDLCVVSTLTFERLFAFLVPGHGRRQLLWFEVTRHPTAEWLARQTSQSCWATPPLRSDMIFGKHKCETVFFSANIALWGASK
jgi:hypothetical protein